MAGSLHSIEYKILIDALVTARNERGMTQATLATALGRPPSFVAKVELRERRLDREVIVEVENHVKIFTQNRG